MDVLTAGDWTLTMNPWLVWVWIPLMVALVLGNRTKADDAKKKRKAARKEPRTFG